MASFLFSTFARIGRNKLTMVVPKNLVNLRAHSKLEGATHKVNNLEKKFLVWTGKYKTVAEVPTYVSQSIVERARNRMRIKIANYMMAATALGCLAMVYLGKKAAKGGDSVSRQNLEWHRQYNEKVAALEAADNENKE